MARHEARIVFKNGREHLIQAGTEKVICDKISFFKYCNSDILDIAIYKLEKVDIDWEKL